jgi:hypothetical protein
MTEIRDDNGLFTWYRDRFYPDDIGNSAFDWTRLFGLLTHFQREYAKATGHRCRGLRFMHLNTRNGYCRGVLCPTCWHRRHTQLFTALGNLAAKGGYVWARESWHVPCEAQLHPKLVARFKIKRSNCRMLCYTLNYYAVDTRGQLPTLGQRVPFDGELAYQLTGLFHSDRLITEYGLDKHDQLHVYDGEELAGVIDREQLDVEHAAHVWAESLHHPWEWRWHDNFSTYLTRFRPHTVGRNCTRTNNAYLKEE